MNKIFVLSLFAILVFSASFVSAGVDSINYPRENDIITYTARIPLNVSSTASTGCYFTYETANGIVPFNQSVGCDGVSFVNLPNSDGDYNITVADDGGSSITRKITIDKPSGILVTAIYVLTFLILLGMLFVFILNLAKFVTLETNIYNLAVSWTIFFALLIAYQLNIEYTAVPFVLNWINVIMMIGGFTLFLFPLIALIIIIFKKSTDKKRPISIEELTGRKLLKYV